MSNKASNWQIVAQIKLFSDLCDGISYTDKIILGLCTSLVTGWLVVLLVDKLVVKVGQKVSFETHLI